MLRKYWSCLLDIYPDILRMGRENPDAMVMMMDIGRYYESMSQGLETFIVTTGINIFPCNRRHTIT